MDLANLVDRSTMRRGRLDRDRMPLLGQLFEHPTLECPRRMELGPPRYLVCAQNQCLQHQQDQSPNGGETEAVRGHRIAFGATNLAGGIRYPVLGELQEVLGRE